MDMSASWASERAQAGRHRSAALLHIPASELGGALSEIKKIGRVLAESQTGEDVTKQSTGLDARLVECAHRRATFEGTAATTGREAERRAGGGEGIDEGPRRSRADGGGSQRAHESDRFRDCFGEDFGSGGRRLAWGRLPGRAIGI